MTLKSAATVAACLALNACSLSAGTAAGPGAPVTLSIIGTNDVHGGILATDDRGGLALFGGYLRNLRAARAGDGAVLLIDAGDMWQGTMESNLSEGAVVVEAYNQLGYTAATIGNHEFDFGPEGEPATPRGPDDDPRGSLKARARMARFPMLAANILDATTGEPVVWPNVTPSVTVAYQLSEDANVYLRYAEGYRSGGFNGRSSTPDQVRTAFEPETLDAYELGLKSLLWERRLQLNLAAFLSDYKDLQQVLTAPTSTGVGFQTINDNVGKIQITGAEVETRLAALEQRKVNQRVLEPIGVRTLSRPREMDLPVVVGSGQSLANSS